MSGQPTSGGDIRAQLHELVQHLEHVLPGQAPIRDFVHHNTLHGYQHLPFTEALTSARELTGAQGYLPPERFWEFYAHGRIDASDLDAALDEAEVPDLAEGVAAGRSRRAVLTTVLRYSFKRLSRSQLRWQLEESGATVRLQPDLDTVARARMLAVGGEAEVVRDLWAACLECLDLQEALRHPEELLDEGPGGMAEEGDAALVGHRLRKEAHDLLDQLLARLGGDWSLRSLLLALTGEDLLDTLRPALIRPLAAYLDQGLAGWHAPERNLGFYAAWRAYAGRDTAWLLDDLGEEWRQVAERLPDDPFDALIQELRLLGLPETRWVGYIVRLALEIPGWSGMMLQRSLRPGYGGTTAPVAMMDFLAVRLILERVYSQRICRRHWRAEASLHGLSWHFHHNSGELLVRQALFDGKLPEYLVDFAERLVREAPHRESDARAEWSRVAHLLWRWRQAPSADRKDDVSVAGTAWPLFRLTQHLGLTGAEVRAAGPEATRRLLACLNEFDADRFGYIWLLAYERHYREGILAAVAANHGRCRGVEAAAQLIFCMDDREEGIRRHLEEIAPDLETFGAAAHFNVPHNWRGLDDEDVTALAPVIPAPVIPAHEVREICTAGNESGQAAHNRRHALRTGWHRRLMQGSRRGVIGQALYVAAAAPATLAVLVGKAMAPARLGALAEALARKVDGQVPTRLAFVAANDSPPASPEAPRLGFTDIEQADRVQSLLTNIGLTSGFSPLVAIIGHGSRNLNNPHASAYNCGACSGRFSGPNARLVSAMANRPDVRAMLAERGIAIPEATWFVGAEHDTCDDRVIWYDIDQAPEASRPLLERTRISVEQASRAHAQERCRRLASAPLDISLEQAWRHVSGRRHDYSQVRPELGHATNAFAIFGRRNLSRGVFFDRRAFLISYDPTRDPEGKVLEQHLLINGAVGAGISLEYYFSTVDNERYGSGTKVVHNVAGYFGVMEGASSDLRTGLPKQMIEIHEAMRLLVVVEQKLDVITKIYQRQPPLQEVIGNGWVVVAAKDPDSAAIHLFDPAKGWVAWQPGAVPPTVARSRDWYRGHRDPLAPALLVQSVEG
jgi:uncharacterized protein YbcC (UPF0753/DUF2309 family)